MSRSWQTNVVAVWPADGAHPAQAIVVARMLEEGMGYREGPRELDVRRVAIVADPRGRPRVAEPALGATDWRITSSPTAPDLDGDGLPEAVQVGPDPAAQGHCGLATSECVACEVPGGEAVTIRGSTGATLLEPTHFSNTVRDPALDARLTAALAHYADSIENDPPPCPSLQPSYQTDRVHSRPWIRRTAEGAELGWSYTRLACRGWGANPATNARDSSCDVVGGRFRTVSLRGPDTSSDAEDRDAGVETTVSASCDGCTVHAVLWGLPDTDRAPHRLPIVLAASELAHPAGIVLEQGRHIIVPPNVYAVQVQRGAEVLGTWQVTITPWDRAPITITP